MRGRHHGRSCDKSWIVNIGVSVQEDFKKHTPHLLLIGGATGLLSGVFGVGGGIILVPLLIMFLGFGHRSAAGTSAGAVLPAAIVGGTSYAINGDVDWVAAIALSIGIVGGAQVGSILLERLPERLLQVIFLIFLSSVLVSLWFVIPDRESVIELSSVALVALLLVGFLTGVLSVLVGVGGGVLVVPVLILFFGASDLIAKGTSLLMIIPGSLSATFGNLRYRNIDIPRALLLGITAGAISPLGVMISNLLSPTWSNILFSLLLSFVVCRMAVSLLRNRNK